ncbi:hypothetical protein AGABI1DRAFT_92026 [Agaricus bisporus var. burnettii JB137-S8]|nr:uncharacterized protein AGABI1DRAFT_92026 [Agaricus bisporus var. burnettii JB137-S8]EKM79514.1 hypothetical protein AGABI1DRAFT_92026 [Agaricus bisporus var. burnettii JB137-S8]
MHLIWENLIPNLILFWTGSFKELDHQDQAYVISPANWAAIGKATAESKATIPSGFGAPPPNVATQRSQMTSEMYCNWTLFIAPIVLRGKFSNPAYYRHFMDLVGLLKLCLALEIDGEEMERVDRGFETWVKDYEKLYYQHKPERLSACPLTVHALLHIGWSIRTMGPVWTYWAFPMERHCNLLLTSIGSRRHPYASMNAFVTATAQLDQIRLKFNAHQILCLKPPEKVPRYTFVHPSYPSYQLCPPKRIEIISQHICNKIYAALATRFGTSRAVIQAAFSLQEPVPQYGKVIRLEGGDRIVASELVQSSEDSRDASYIKYIQTVDRFARQRNRMPELVPQIFYGQLKRLLVLEVPPIPQLLQDLPTKIIFAVVQSIRSFQENNVNYYTNLGPIEIVDLSVIECVVGRVKDGNRWGVVDRSNVAENVFD